MKNIIFTVILTVVLQISFVQEAVTATVIVKYRGDISSLRSISTRVLSARPMLQPSKLPISIVGFKTEMIKSRFDGVQVLRTETSKEARDVVKNLQDDPNIEYVFIEPKYELAVYRAPASEQGNSSTRTTQIDDWTDLQDHLFPSPRGVDAMFAWTVPGGKGENVKIADIEWGWDVKHAELRDNIEGIFNGNNMYSDHGTAVLGELIGKNDGKGITGIVPEAKAIGVSVGNADYPTVAEYILFAASKLEAGDVILLEMHADGPNSNGYFQQGYIPMEYFPANFDAIKEVTSRGIVVVEAAGNGDENLDDPIYERIFDRTFQDSGAIMVGAGAPPRDNWEKAPHLSRLAFSNNGSRVDVMGYGTAVTTTGYGDLFHRIENNLYTSDFGGTSSASPIVTGVVAALQSMARETGKYIPPSEMRSLIKSTAAKQNYGPLKGTIGGLPDIKTAWELYNNNDRRPAPEILEPAQNRSVTKGESVSFKGRQYPGETCSFNVINPVINSVITKSDKCEFSYKFSSKGHYIVEFNVYVNGVNAGMPAVREIVVDDEPVAPELYLKYQNNGDLAFPVFEFSKSENWSGKMFIQFSSSRYFEEDSIVSNYRLRDQEVTNGYFIPFVDMMEGLEDGEYFARMFYRSGIGDSHFSNIVKFGLKSAMFGLELSDLGLEMSDVLYSSGEFLVTEEWIFDDKESYRQVLKLFDADSILAGEPMVYGSFNATYEEQRKLAMFGDVLISGGGMSALNFYMVPYDESVNDQDPFKTMYLGYSTDGMVIVGNDLFIYSNEGKIFDIDLNDGSNPRMKKEYDIEPLSLVSMHGDEGKAYFATKNGIIRISEGMIDLQPFEGVELTAVIVHNGKIIVASKNGANSTISEIDNGKFTQLNELPMRINGFKKLAGKICARSSDGFYVLSSDLSKVFAYHRTASANIPRPFDIKGRAFMADGRLKEYRFRD